VCQPEDPDQRVEHDPVGPTRHLYMIRAGFNYVQKTGWRTASSAAGQVWDDELAPPIGAASDQTPSEGYPASPLFCAWSLMGSHHPVEIEARERRLQLFAGCEFPWFRRPSARCKSDLSPA
jgi:hypothetical protein